MILSYPIIITKDTNFLSVFIPDFNMNTQGENMDEALFMAKDSILMMSDLLREEGKSIPEPSNIQSIQSENSEDIITTVKIDFQSISEMV